MAKTHCSSDRSNDYFYSATQTFTRGCCQLEPGRQFPNQQLNAPRGMVTNSPNWASLSTRLTTLFLLRPSYGPPELNFLIFDIHLRWIDNLLQGELTLILCTTYHFAIGILYDRVLRFSPNYSHRP